MNNNFLDIQGTYKLVVNFLENVGMRGVMTMFGVRMTPGSFENPILRKEELKKSFNAIYRVKYFLLKEEGRK